MSAQPAVLPAAQTPLPLSSPLPPAPPTGLRAWCMLAGLYTTQGIPLGVAMDAMPTVLRSQGMALSVLAFLPLVGLPWVLKFLWAPWVDNHWSPRWGRRRSWIVPMQTVVLLCLLGMAAVGLSAATAAAVVGLAVLGSLASATQDIATDGLSVEQFPASALAYANALQVGGTMVGFFLGGAGCLILSGWMPQKLALLLLALPVAVSLLLVACWRERPVLVPEGRARASLARLARRHGVGPLLLLAVLSSMVAVAGFGLAKLYLVDAQWSLASIGTLGLASGMGTVFVGCGLGAWAIRRYGVRTVFLAGVALAGAGALLWAGVALQWLALSPALAFAACLLGSIGAGGLSVALMTAAMRFARGDDQAGTDMTAVQSTRDLGEILTSSALISLAAAFGYGGGFALAALVAVLALALGRKARALSAL